MSMLHSSTRRPEPLKDSNYDHKIILVDQTRSSIPGTPRSESAAQRLSSVLSDSSSRRHSDAPLHKHGSTLRQDWGRRRWTKYRDDGGEGRALDRGQTQEAADEPGSEEDIGQSEEDRGRPREWLTSKKNHNEPDSAIDVLYENQRGGFLCGIPLFSSRALGNLDPAPWTNIALKASATDITNAQVPDPCWEWAWKDWSINRTDEVDDEGWEYSFAFAKQFSWHGPSWWNSFVRRRAWIRKRIRKHVQQLQESNMLSDNYFIIHPVHGQVRSRSRISSMEESGKGRYSVKQLAKREVEDEDLISEDIQDITSLMNVLRFLRIDREKLEAVESFIRHGADEVILLKDHMHDMMGIFVFQASRRLLLAHLIRIFEEQSYNVEDVGGKHTESDASRKLESLQQTITAAENEVKRLEFWSDVKEMAEN